MYLLQLVQALKYEEASALRSRLADFLIDRAVRNHVLGNFLYWWVYCAFYAYYKVFFLSLQC